MTKMIKLFLSFTFILGLSYAQSLEGNWDLNAAIVEYTYEVREFDSVEDTLNASYSVTASWPSSAAAAAGMGYTHTLLSYDIGDTITVALVPLINEDLLAANGVAMNVDLFDDGNFSINEGSTYPTTETIDCSTFATVPGVNELGTWTSTPGFDHPDDPTVHSMGWGISLSDVFAQFNAADIAGGEYGVNYGVGTDMENWGMVTIGYDDEAHTTPQDLEIFWEAHDGTASGLGVSEEDGGLNGVTGVPTSPADTVSIYNMEMYLAYVHEDTNLWYNLGWTGSDDDEWYSMPALGGGGHPIDPTDSETFTINPITGDTLPVGTVSANHGYLFDPTGGDGVPFNGDEALAPTGYFFTFNFLEANQVFSGVFEAVLAATGDLQTSLTAASDSVAFIYLDSESSAAIGAGVGSALYDQYVACVGAGGDADECSAVFQQGPTATLLQVQSACQYQCGVDDSGWDFDEEDGTGRLVFEVDNRCIPDNTTQRVNTFWTYAGETITELEVDEDAPIAQKFTLHGNYPNPFNPVTKIRFATEKTSDVKVTIYSMLGEEVSVAHNGQLSSGTYDISWHGKDSRGNKVPSGVYFYEVRSDERTHKGKMLLLK